MATEAGKSAARRAALAIMASRDWKPAALATAADVDPGTAGDFLLGKRWPKVGTLGKLDAALGLTRGTLAAIGEELQDAPAPPDPVEVQFELGAVSDDDLLSEVRRRMGGTKLPIEHGVGYTDPASPLGRDLPPQQGPHLRSLPTGQDSPHRQ